jgi:hypothetical protein
MSDPGQPRHGMMRSTAQHGATVGTDPGATALIQEADLAYESGVEIKARSQWQYARMRFFRHKLAVVSLIVLILFGLVAIFAKQLAPYGYDEINLEVVDPETGLALSPRLEDWHLFGTDQLGRDYLSRVIYGIRTSLWVALFVALLSTALGTAVGAVSGYYGGRVDNLLMRFTDLILTLPGLAVLLTAAVYFGSNDSEVTVGPLTFTIPQPMKIGLILAFLFWVGLAPREGVRGGGEGCRRERHAHHRAPHTPELRRPDRRLHDVDHRRRDSHRGRALVHRLRHPAAERGPREAHRRRPERGFHSVVAGRVPRPRDHVDRTRDQLRG